MQLQLPEIVLGTSMLGNIYKVLTQEEKTDLVGTYVRQSARPIFFDTAGKYGAGLALESLSAALHQLKIPKEDVIISNKLGWYRIPLTTDEPTFEKGIWRDLTHDATQKMGYEGIMDCFNQGNELLNGYDSRFVSVHDPDEYLAAAVDANDRQNRYNEILAAYDALFHLKMSGKADAVGVGAKDWTVIQELSKDVQFDWVMFANSMTIHNHPPELYTFIQSLSAQNVWVINSAVFNGGFLTGGEYYNYQFVDNQTDQGRKLIEWRHEFYKFCAEYNIDPVAAALQFGLNIPGVKSIAISSSDSERLHETMEMSKGMIPEKFWDAFNHSTLSRS